MENKKITTKELVFNRFLKPLINWTEECQLILDFHQKDNLWNPKNIYLQTFLVSHIFEMIGKIYIALTRLRSLDDNGDIDSAISGLFKEMKEWSHKLDILYSSELKTYFWIKDIKHVKREPFSFLGEGVEFNCNYYQVNFEWGDAINICHTENARYWIFWNGFPEIFIANQSDVNLKLGMMVGILKDFCSEEIFT